MYGIHEKVYRQLMDYFHQHTGICKVLLFGSRAKGNAKNHSDIDLYIQTSQASKPAIMENIDEMIGVYSCDIVFEGQCSEELKKQIMRDGIVIYKKGQFR